MYNIPFHTVSELLQRICQIITFGTGLYLIPLFGSTPEVWTMKFGLKELETLRCRVCTKYFDILNRLVIQAWITGVTDRQTDRITIHVAIAYI